MRREEGFTLIEIAIVIAVLGLLLTVLIGISASLIAQQRTQTTRTRLTNIDTALTLFVSVNKRLPCPADGQLSASAGGSENATTGPPRTCNGNQQHGVVPWRALGLASTDIEDGWGRRFTYRVGPELVVNDAMDFTACDPAGTSTTVRTSPSTYCIPTGTGVSDCNGGNLGFCTPPAIALRSAINKGLVVENVAGTVIMDPRGSAGTCAAEVSTGAAYVVISHGAEGGGGYGPEGVLATSTVTAGTMEAMNFANLVYTAPVCSVAPASFAVDDTLNAVGTTHFDDYVSRPSILALATRAQVGPRAH
jgi:prepilin-type N-terminal cleavage/methylation domain-containing protein